LVGRGGGGIPIPKLHKMNNNNKDEKLLKKKFVSILPLSSY